MFLPEKRSHRRGAQLLVLATLFWALSFPLVRALLLLEESRFGAGKTVFFSALIIVIRFGLGALIMGVWSASSLARISRREWKQGIGLGLFAWAGLVFQTDGLAYTQASISAFLTQGYCVIIPIYVGLRDRRFPGWRVVATCLVMLAGLSILSGFDWKHFRLGRGEWETLAAAAFFTGQILWLERKEFAANNVKHSTFIMFLLIALGGIPLTFVRSADWREAAEWLSLPSVWIFLVLLVLFCTVGAYTLMNYGQPFVDATSAGLIYCMEPVATSLLALILPGFLSRIAQIDYPNEAITRELLVGGVLVTGANIYLQWKPRDG